MTGVLNPQISLGPSLCCRLRIEPTFPEDLLGARQVPYTISLDAHNRPYAVDMRILIHK